MPPESDNTQVLVAIAEIKGAIGQALGEIQALRGVDVDHESRLRHIEAKPIPDPATAERLRALEERRTISPAQLWGGLLGVSAVLGTAAGIISILPHS